MNKTLGLALRARKVLIGTDLVINGLTKNQIKLVLLSSDASSNTQKLVINKATYYDIPYLILDDTVMNQAIGRMNIKVLGITDDGFANLLLDKKGM